MIMHIEYLETEKARYMKLCSYNIHDSFVSSNFTRRYGFIILHSFS